MSNPAIDLDSVRIRMTKRAWRRMTTELHRRGSDRKESGAFLLGSATSSRRRVTAVVYFDDLDANCLVGGISFSRSGFDKLWEICERKGLRVIGDVHTHPGDHVQQSLTDEQHPMIAVRGHVAIVLPHYAKDQPSVDDGSVNVFAGAHTWAHFYGTETRAVVRLSRTWWWTR